MSEDADRFYDRLPAFREFRRIAEPDRFVPVPADWLIAIADVRNSTDAIDAGRYRDVNTVGALCIAALLNAAGDIDIPFIFGGDGATVVLPPSLREKAESALRGTRRLAAKEFGLRLSVGLVPVAAAYDAGERLGVAKFEVSPLYTQAVFVGGGLAYADHLVKSPDTAPFALGEDPADLPAYEPDYSGYSCRWRDVLSPRGESVSLLVQPLGSDPEQTAILRAVLEEVERTYGDARARHPISPGGLRPALSAEAHQREAKVFATENAGRRRYKWRVLFETLVMNFWIATQTKTSADRLRRRFPCAPLDAAPTDWGRYKENMIEASDCQKIDGLLRMVISGDTVQRENLTAYLEKEYQARRLAYGVHVAPAALMTCLVFQPNGRQVHFVDGANGGYALASRALKGRLAAIL